MGSGGSETNIVLSEDGKGFLEIEQSIQKDMIKLLASQSRQMGCQTFERMNAQIPSVFHRT